MVKYFGEQLSGYAFTQHGWVQSYGSRCVAPPIIWGDVSRPEPMTVRWSAYAQSITARPMKGMLTGPVTMLQWSFVRDDIAREQVCRQIALAIRDEVADLEAGRHRRDPGRRAGVPRGPAAAPIRLGCLFGLGGGVLSSCHLGRARRNRDPHPHVLLRSSTTSWARSRRWTPTRSRSRRRAAAWSCSMPSCPAPTAMASPIPPRSGRACGTSTARAYRVPRRWRACCASPAIGSPTGRSGSTRIAG